MTLIGIATRPEYIVQEESIYYCTRQHARTRQGIHRQAKAYVKRRGYTQKENKAQEKIRLLLARKYEKIDQDVNVPTSACNRPVEVENAFVRANLIYGYGPIAQNFSVVVGRRFAYRGEHDRVLGKHARTNVSVPITVAEIEPGVAPHVSRQTRSIQLGQLLACLRCDSRPFTGAITSSYLVIRIKRQCNEKNSCEAH
jgi:hypothetical protein